MLESYYSLRSRLGPRESAWPVVLLGAFALVLIAGLFRDLSGA